MGIFSSDVKQIVITFDNQKLHRPYIPSETVTGQVVVTTDKEGVKVQRLTLKIVGRLEVEWKVSNSGALF